MLSSHCPFQELLHSSFEIILKVGLTNLGVLLVSISPLPVLFLVNLDQLYEIIQTITLSRWYVLSSFHGIFLETMSRMCYVSPHLTLWRMFGFNTLYVYTVPIKWNECLPKAHPLITLWIPRAFMVRSSDCVPLASNCSKTYIFITFINLGVKVRE